jgi:3-hydroxyacyl-[acyl-carrier-protein] dehydratase
MILKNNYYKTISRESGGEGDTVFRIALLPDCKIYDGHFPGNPVCPGVYNIQTIKECVEEYTGKSLRMGSIRQCRLTAVITPRECDELEVHLVVTPTEGGYQVVARICDATQTYLEYKGEMNV